jgi:phage terminase large subunit-like protein
MMEKPLATTSSASSIESLPKEHREQLVQNLSDEDATEVKEYLENKWEFQGRHSQKPPPGDWRVWLLLAGRGFGKTRAGAEFVRAMVNSKKARRIALVGSTALDVRSVMVEGESGLLSIGPPFERPRYEPSLHRLSWNNGAVATLFSADEPNRLRGPEHDLAWCDELAAWRYPQAWDMLMFGLRLGRDPRVVVTTTPRPIKLLRDLIADPKVVVTRGRTEENARNLAPAFLEQIVRRYRGTRLGRQELDGELLDDMPGALWTHALIDAARMTEAPDLARIVVAIDPAVSSHEGADETGIVVAGSDRNGHGYVLADASGRYAPTEWARAAVAAYAEHRADRIVAEVNNGGRDGRGDVARRRSERAVHRGARLARQGRARRAGRRIVRAGQGAPSRRPAIARRPDVRLRIRRPWQFRPEGGRLFARPGRRAGVALTDLLLAPMPGGGVFNLYRDRATEALEQVDPGESRG